MHSDPSFYLVSAAVVFLTGVSKSGFAGGLGVLAVPLMSLFVPPQTAAAIMMPILYAMDIANIWKYRNSWSRKVILSLLPGALIGLGIGAATFEWLSADMLRIGIGLLALYSAAGFLRMRFFRASFLRSGELEAGGTSEAPGKTSLPATVLIGALSGLTSFVAHAGGPPVKGYLLRQNMDKSAFVGTNSVFFFTLNQIKIVSYVMIGQISFDSLVTSATLSPFLLLGVFAGFRLHAVVNQNTFTIMAYAFLTVAGCKLIWDGSGLFL